MEKEELYRIHIQQRTAAGEWEDLPFQGETESFILLQMARRREKEGVKASLMNVQDRDIALMLMHVKLIRDVVMKSLPLFLLADKIGAGDNGAEQMDAEAMLTQIMKRDA